jgi:vacuolar-type H+-ATPase subunit I/STV1
MTDFRDPDLSSQAMRDSGSFGERSGSSAGSAPEIGRMGRQKVELTNQMTGAVSEMERLRMRQDELEKEKSQLQDLARRQEEYERGKRDAIEKLSRGIVLFEKEEAQANRMAEMLMETRSQFRQILAELKQIDEEKWSDENFREELGNAMARVEAARDIHKKALARIEASSWHRSARADVAEVAESASGGLLAVSGFGRWFKIGLAFSLPLIAVVVLVFLAYLWTAGYFHAAFSGL